MKLSFILLIVTFFQASAVTFAQKVSIKVVEAPIKEVFYQLSKQTGYNFMTDASLSRKIKAITLDVKDTELRQVLERCFDGIAVEVLLNADHKTAFVKEAPQGKGATYMLDSRQQIEVTGTVTGENNEPLPAVSVAVKGTSIRAVSDTQGKFRIHVPNREAVLVFSYLGYSAQERVVGNDEVVYIKLIRAVSEIEEVVVNIGYGEVKKEDLTGAVGQVNVEELQKAPVATFDQALAGRVAGVQVSGNDGQPGTPNNIVIRGNNSLTQDNSPLYVVDGFPVETFTESPVSPSDIESIHVLKDASATAIYGSRGANGVIIITTKKGTDSDPVISLNSYYGFQKVIRRLEMMSPYEFVKYQNELNPITTERLYLDGRTLDDYKDMPGIDMQDALYQVAPAHNHDVAFRGGNKGTQYAVFANLFKSDGIIQNSGYTRGQGKFTLSQQLKKNIRAYLNANYTKTVTSGSIISDPTGGIPSLSIIYSALGYRPISGFDDVDLMDELFDPAIITETPTDYRLNPVISVNNEINERVLNSIIVNGHIDFKLNKRLTLKVKGGLISNEFNTSKFYNSKTQIGNPNYPTSKGTTGGIYSRRTDNWLNENTLTYNRTIKKHKLNILAGFTMQNNKLSYSGYTSSFIEDEDLGIDGIDLSTSLVPDTYRKEWSLASFLGRVNYDYNKKYLVTLSFRSDGSSKFRGNNKWGHFPSGAFAWRMSNEPFIKDIRFISDAKLRVGYGMTGNNRVDEYATYSGIAFPFTSYYSFNNATPGRGASLQTTTGVPDLRWETTSQFNLGYDLSVIRNRIQFTFDYYNKTTTDLLLNANLPYTTGYLTAFQNIGSVRNHGLEFTIQTDIIKTKNFLWSSAFNISFNRNKILKLQPAQSYRLANVSFVGDFHNVAPYVAKVDQPMGIIYGAISDGLYQYGDFDLLPDGSYFLKNEVPTNGRARNTLQPGDMKFVDVNNDGTITAEDYVPIGNANPRHVGGFSNDFNYRNFDLNIFLQWSYGNDILNGNRLYFEQNTYNLYNLNMFASVTDRWTPENQNTTIPRVGGVPPRIYHTNIIEDGSFLRLKTVSLGYTFSDKVLLPAKIKTARIYMAAQNIFTWTNYSGSDPEVSVRNSPLTPGFDWSAYPRARTITFGLNVSF